MTDINDEGFGPSRRKAIQIVDHDSFKAVIIGLIVLNAITLGVETVEALPDSIRQAIRIFDIVVVGVFVIELSLKLYAWRLDFFRSGWNIFDFVVVGVSLAPGAHAFQVIRSLRVLRVLRLLHVVPMMRRIVEALFKALPGMGAIMAVLALMVYASAVMTTTLYGRTSDLEVHALFGDLPSSAFTLFQVMTMDGWRNEVVQKVMDDGHPFAWVFFLSFIFLASFAVLNLFIALIVEALQAEQEAAQEETIEHLEDAQEAARRETLILIDAVSKLHEEIQSMREEMKAGKEQ